MAVVGAFRSYLTWKESAKDPKLESALKIYLVQPSAPRCANGALLKYRLGSIGEVGILKAAVWGKYYDRSTRRWRMGYAADRCVLCCRVKYQY